MTTLDDVYASLAANADDAARHGQFYGQVAATELLLVLDAPAGEASVKPLVLTAGEEEVVLAFDTAERMASFLGRTAEYASLPGRTIVEMLQGSGLTLGLNFEAP
ncbi:MAG: SseB family protein, partial [Pseudomonadota bacterium]